MGNKVTFDYSKASTFVAKHEVDYMSKLAMDAKELLLSRKGAGNDFLGWIDLPVDYSHARSPAFINVSPLSSTPFG